MAIGKIFNEFEAGNDGFYVNLLFQNLHTHQK